VAGCCECGDALLGSGATELVWLVLKCVSVLSSYRLLYTNRQDSQIRIKMSGLQTVF
jgi:hypothetical protein